MPYLDQVLSDSWYQEQRTYKSTYDHLPVYLSRQISLGLKNTQSAVFLCLTFCVQSNHLFANLAPSHCHCWQPRLKWNLGILLLNCCLVALKELPKSIRTHVIVVLQSKRTADYLWDLSPVNSYLCATEKEEPWAHLISSRCLSSLHRLWYLVSRTLFAKGLNRMPRGLKVSRPLIANMIPFITISNFFKWKKYLHYDIWSSTLWYLRW